MGITFRHINKNIGVVTVEADKSAYSEWIDTRFIKDKSFFLNVEFDEGKVQHNVAVQYSYDKVNYYEFTDIVTLPASDGSFYISSVGDYELDFLTEYSPYVRLVFKSAAQERDIDIKFIAINV